MAANSAGARVGNPVVSYYDPSAPAAGMIVPYAGTVAPTGWLFCNGIEYSQTTYADLFTAIGTSHNTQIDPTTGSAWAAPSAGNFRVPDYRGIFLRGVGTASGLTGVTLAGYQAHLTAKNGLANAASTVTGTIGSTDLSHTHAPGTFAASIGLSGTAPSLNGTTNFPSAGHYHAGTTGVSDQAYFARPNGGGVRSTQIKSTGLGGASFVTATIDVSFVGTAEGSTGTVGIAGGGYSLTGSNAVAGTSGAASIGASINHSHTLASGSATGQVLTGDAETRPLNKGVNYIIRAFNPIMAAYGAGLATSVKSGLVSNAIAPTNLVSTDLTAQTNCTIDAGDVGLFRYSMVNGTVFLSIVLNVVTITGGAANVNFQLPASVPRPLALTTASFNVFDASSSVAVAGQINVSTSGVVFISKLSGTFTGGTNNNYLQGQIFWQVA